MRPGEILDAQIDLIDRLEGNEPFRTYLGGWIQSEFSSHGGEVIGDRGLALLRSQVGASYAYRVSHDMTAMVEFAASQLDGTDQIDLSLAPTGCGIVCFDKPLPVKDVRNKTMLLHWLVWGPAAVADKDGKTLAGTAIWTFNDLLREPDQVATDFLVQHPDISREDYAWLLGHWGAIGFDMMFDQMRVGPQWTVPSEEKAAQVLADGDEPVPGNNVIRYVHALWLLLNQTVTKVEPEDVDRPARRRATRKRLPPQVTVIRLRREEGHYEPREGESLVEWQHRWIVRGHWRWQACGPNRSERRRIWVNPYVKGPEGAPLKQSEKVYSLDR
jgi:hypothetical protein